MQKLVTVCLACLVCFACGEASDPAPSVRPLTAEETARFEKERADERGRRERTLRAAEHEEAKAMLDLAMAAETPISDREYKLNFAIEAFFDLLPAIPEASADLDRALDLMLKTDATDDHLAISLIGRWDEEEAHRPRLRPVFERMRAAHLAALRKAKFDPDRRYRDEDVARYVRTGVYKTDADSPNYCSQVSGNIAAMHELSRRLGAPDTKVWQLHRTDLILYHRACDGVGDAYEGQEAYAEAYSSYLDLGRKEDAQRVAHQAADESLGYYVWGSSFTRAVPPERPEYLEYAVGWLEKLPAGQKAAILREHAEDAAKDGRSSAAEKLYEILGEPRSVREARQKAD